MFVIYIFLIFYFFFSYIFLYRLPNLAELLLQMNNLEVFDRIYQKSEYITEQDIECSKYWFRKQSKFNFSLHIFTKRVKQVYSAIKTHFDFFQLLDATLHCCVVIQANKLILLRKKL